MPMEFEELVELHYRSLYRFAFSLTHQEAEACDLTQQTFLIWAEKRGQVRDKSKTKSWLFTTLHREYLGRLRKITRFPAVEIDSVQSELPPVSSVSDAAFDGRTALAALAKLDPNFRSAVALFYLEDYSQPEIASILEIPLGTVKSRISRGIARLQEILAEPQRPAHPMGRPS